jgi:hypothetical protein
MKKKSVLKEPKSTGKHSEKYVSWNLKVGIKILPISYSIAISFYRKYYLAYEKIGNLKSSGQLNLFK